MRSDLVRIVGAAALTERVVRDLWPLAVMEDRAGLPRDRVMVARPADRDQVAALVRWAAGSGVTLVPLGGGSGVCGAVSPRAGELVVDLAGLDRILEIDETNLVCRCEAGVNGYELEKRLNSLGLTLGHYPSSLPGTTVGGLISTRSSGQESSRFGSVEDMVIGLGVVLPDGSYAAPRPGPRSAAGPALHELWLGAEGALGIVVEAVLRIHRMPDATVGRAYGFPDLESGLECMRSVMQSGIRPLVMRLYDPEDTVFNGYDVGEGGCLLVVAAAGLAGVARAEADAIRSLSGDARDLGEGVWERWEHKRFDLSAERMTALLEPAGAYLDTIELAAPWTKLPELHGRVKSAIGVGGIALCHFSHAYEQGCCAYFTFGGSGETEDEARAAYRRAWEGAMSAAIEIGATISHHHGVGQARARWIEDEMGGWMRVWRSVRKGVDPNGLMNPSAVGGRR